MYADNTTMYFNLEDFEPETHNNETNSEHFFELLRKCIYNFSNKLF